MLYEVITVLDAFLLGVRLGGDGLELFRIDVGEALLPSDRVDRLDIDPLGAIEELRASRPEQVSIAGQDFIVGDIV